jgi:hypothetical protein
MYAFPETIVLRIVQHYPGMKKRGISGLVRSLRVSGNPAVTVKMDALPLRRRPLRPDLPGIFRTCKKRGIPVPEIRYINKTVPDCCICGLIAPGLYANRHFPKSDPAPERAFLLWNEKNGDFLNRA